jgi:Domain of unknown function (DUF4326)
VASRIQLCRVKGWRLPEGAVSVARPTKWGNPYRIGGSVDFPYSEVFGSTVRDRAHAVEIFTMYARIRSGYAMLARHELAGKDLACWCPLTEPCHADVLLEVANGEVASDG